MKRARLSRETESVAGRNGLEDTSMTRDTKTVTYSQQYQTTCRCVVAICAWLPPQEQPKTGGRLARQRHVLRCSARNPTWRGCHSARDLLGRNRRRRTSRSQFPRYLLHMGPRLRLQCAASHSGMPLGAPRQLDTWRRLESSRRADWGALRSFGPHEIFNFDFAIGRLRKLVRNVKRGLTAVLLDHGEVGQRGSVGLNSRFQIRKREAVTLAPASQWVFHTSNINRK